MPRLISSYRESKYQSKDDLVHPLILTVIKIVDETMPQDQRIRPVAYFAEGFVDGVKIKPLILNVTNLSMLGNIAGITDLDHWPTGGVKAEFYNDKSVNFQGNVGAVRCRPVSTLKSKQLGNSKVQAHGYDDAQTSDFGDDIDADIPF